MISCSWSPSITSKQRTREEEKSSIVTTSGEKVARRCSAYQPHFKAPIKPAPTNPKGTVPREPASEGGEATGGDEAAEQAARA